ncbi:MAG: creatininase family protein [Actinobacteria bacterium]|nr:creatininase family protein [Actinomycetota bacterium]
MSNGSHDLRTDALGVDLSDLTSPEAQELIAGAPLALLPVGATEQHGPHLGMGTDWRIARAIALRAASELAPRAVVVPALPFGLSAHHMDFGGTITIGFETLRGVCIDVVRSLHRHGVRKFVFVNAHKGNESALGVIVTQLSFDFGIDAAVSFWMTQAKDVIERHRGTQRWGHACEIETSVAMALAPDLVRENALAAGDLIEDYGALEDNYEPYSLTVPKPFSERTRNGAFGDATQASREAGEEIATAAVARLVGFCKDFIAR